MTPRPAPSAPAERRVCRRRNSSRYASQGPIYPDAALLRIVKARRFRRLRRMRTHQRCQRLPAKAGIKPAWMSHSARFRAVLGLSGFNVATHPPPVHLVQTRSVLGGHGPRRGGGQGPLAAFLSRAVAAQRAEPSSRCLMSIGHACGSPDVLQPAEARHAAGCGLAGLCRFLEMHS